MAKRCLDTNVRFIKSDSYGIKPTTTEWGTFIPILDQVLVEGSDPMDVLSITTTQDPEFEDYWISTVHVGVVDSKFEGMLSVVTIEGCSEEKYNNTFRIQEANGGNFKIAFSKEEYPTKPEDVSDTSGTTVRLAPLGLTKVRGTSTKAVYKFRDDTYLGDCYLKCINERGDYFPENHVACVYPTISTDIRGYDIKIKNPGASYAPYDIDEGFTNTLVTNAAKDCRICYEKSESLNSFGRVSQEDSRGPCEWIIFGDNLTIYMLIKNATSGVYSDRDCREFVAGAFEPIGISSNTFFIKSSSVINKVMSSVSINQKPFCGLVSNPFPRGKTYLGEIVPNFNFSASVDNSDYKEYENINTFFKKYLRIYSEIVGVMRGLRFSKFKSRASLRENFITIYRSYDDQKTYANYHYYDNNLIFELNNWRY